MKTTTQKKCGLIGSISTTGTITVSNIGAKGPKGDNGKSAYEIWLAQGNTGTEEDFLLSLKGEPGETPDLSAYATREYVEEQIADKTEEKVTEYFEQVPGYSSSEDLILKSVDGELIWTEDNYILRDI